MAILLFGISFASNSSNAFAATPTPSTTPITGQALEIGPPVLTLVANPGQRVTASLSLRDISQASLIVTNQVDDFTADGENGAPHVILDPTEVNPYSIKSWVTPIPSTTLKVHDVKTIPVVINVPATAAPGGYYGIIRFTGTPPGLDGTGVSLNASLGALVFIRVNGAAKESMNIVEFSANNGAKSKTLFQTAPVNFVERIRNDGNLYEQPTGLVTVTDMFNHKIATLPVNADQRIILPGSIRKFSVNLDNTVIGNRILFGKYHAKFAWNYGDPAQTITKDITFWVLPYTLMIFGIIIVTVLITVLIFLIKRYNKMIIQRAQKKQ